MDSVSNDIVLDDDDKKFLDEMVLHRLIDDVREVYALRSLARLWYERGYFDRLDEESA